ncbi:SRPBCC domain-containing protein [Gracilibacillus sp. YIM 98692]|uniref:SRPBCC domain-containing protein n=1 Tax=Gracilibacillus sp. YIM 98692 TaxID=2663532 RepID=UPI0013D11B43|nr:SRPBCC domain-containing protein [Gracilibacillus sp. YIM 98692]
MASFTNSHEYLSEQVWEVLTNEDYVNKWHPELRMHQLRDGGNIIFDFGNGEFHKLPIREFKEGKIYGFDWYGSYIRFEVEEDGQLLMTFKVNEVNEQSLRDLTGWTMISEAIDATLRGESFTFDKERAGKIRQEYERELEV